MLIKKFAAVAMCCLLAGTALAQEAEVKTSNVATKAAAPVAPQRVKVMLNEEGKLVGKAVLADSAKEDAARKVASNVKVTLTSEEGKVIETVETKEDGTFAFANVAPGAYQMLGSAEGLVGSQSYDVVGYSNSAVASPCSLNMCGASSDVVYDNYSSAPVSSFSTCNSCNTCGGGLGGGSLGGRLGGGLLGNGRIGLIGLAGLAGLGGDDSSPDR